MNAHDMLPSDSEPDTCTCASCARYDIDVNDRPCNQPIPFSITGPGEYKTRDGFKAIITEVYDGRAFGRYSTKGNNWYGTDWDVSGNRYHLSSTCYDIVAKWTEPRKPIEGWVNLYSDDNLTDYRQFFDTEDKAKARSAFGRIATIKLREVTDD